MEFPFNVNNVLGSEVSLIDNKLTPHRNSPNISEYKSQLSTIIDRMGAASAKAQGLRGAITSSSRLACSDHLLYILKDSETNSGHGAVVGILKTGRKKLFVYDHNGGQHEMEPLCILDFYVHESRQRMGCGKKMFEFMCRHENVRPVHLAIDRPSHKFQEFLKKHYHLKATITQVNNFVVFDGFFKDRQDGNKYRNANGRPPMHPHKATVLEKSSSSQPGHKDAVEKQEREKDALCHVPVQRSTSQLMDTPLERPRSGRPVSRNSSVSMTENGHEGMLAQKIMYSRHGGAPSTGNTEILAGSHPSPLSVNIVGVQRSNSAAANPPLLRREGPSQEYLSLHSYQDRKGHLKLTESPTASPGHHSQGDTPLASTTSSHRNSDSAWNIFGVPSRSHSINAVTAANVKKYQQTKLW